MLSILRRPTEQIVRQRLFDAAGADDRAMEADPPGVMCLGSRSSPRYSEQARLRQGYGGHSFA